MKKIALLAIGCIAVTLLWAKPARRGPLVVSQEDGSEIVVYQHGDERFHWTTNEAGEWIEQDPNGKWQVVSALSNERKKYFFIIMYFDRCAERPFLCPTASLLDRFAERLI